MSNEGIKSKRSDTNDDNQLSKYIFQNTIGQGNFGKVKLAIYTPTNEHFAVKILNKEQIQIRNEMNLVQRELNIIKHFNHMNVIYVHQIIEDEINYYIIMDYCERGELFDYIVKNKRLSEDEAAVLFYQLINGVEYIHSKHIVHRDLKPENLLITKNKLLKIIDFGLSSFFGGDRLLSTQCGSPSYAAPEIINKKSYNGFQTDVWCCGIVLYAMVCGYLPFEGTDNNELFRNILICNIEIPEFISEECEELIREMLNTNPDKRITIPMIKTMSFYLKGKTNAEYVLNKKKRTRKIGLNIINSHSDVTAFKKRIISINSKINSNQNPEPLTTKIGEILKTDTTLCNLKTTKNLVIDDSKELKNLFFKKFSQRMPLKQILENRLTHHDQNLLKQVKKKRSVSKKPMITVESNMNNIINPKNKRRQMTCNGLQSQSSTKTNHISRCLPTEPKEFQEYLKTNFNKYINTNSKLQQNNSNTALVSPRMNMNFNLNTHGNLNTNGNTNTTNTTNNNKPIQYSRSKSKEDKVIITNRRTYRYLPKLLSY